MLTERLAEGLDEILHTASWKRRGLPQCPRRGFVNPCKDVAGFCLSHKHNTITEPLEADELMGVLEQAAGYERIQNMD